jgi:hypothetical protein
MNYIDFEVGNKVYKLRLNTRNTILLEKQLGCNPLTIFGTGDTIPTITTMVQILHASLQQYNHGITLNDAYDIFDSYLADGHSMTDFIPVIIHIYQASGLMPKETTNEEVAEKNL